MRLFIALPIPEVLTSALRHAQERLLRAVPEGISTTDLSQAHLTLLFIGERPESELPALKAIVTKIGAEVMPLNLSLTRLSAFPSPQDPRIVWAGVSDDQGQLNRITGMLQQEALALGYPIESRDFVPHLTLARSKQVKNRTSLRLFLEREPLRAESCLISRIVLYQSTPTPTGHSYQELSSITLSGAHRRGAQS